MVSQTTTIQISDDLQANLKSRKITEKESYEEVIWALLEDVSELSEETKKQITKAEQDIKSGRVYSLSQVKKRLS